MGPRKLLSCLVGAFALILFLPGVVGAEEVGFCPIAQTVSMTSAVATQENHSAETPEWLVLDADDHPYSEKVNWCDICDAEPLCYSCCRCSGGNHPYCTSACA